MTLTAYTCNCDNHIVDKTQYLTNSVILQGETRDNSIDIVSPDILVTSAVPLTCNYVFIPRFSRFYYVSVTVIRSGLYLLRCTCDVLMSFSGQIKQAACTAKRTKEAGEKGNINLYVPDSDLPMYAYTEDCVYIFGSFADKWQGGAYVCTVG